MKIKTIFFILIVTFYKVDFAQAQTNNLTLNKSGVAAQTPLQEFQFKQLISNSFSKVLTGQSTGSPGRFASIDLEKTEVIFAPSFTLKNKDVITTKFEGGVTDGVSSVFNNSKLNTNLSLQLQYHLLLCKKSTSTDITLDLDSYSAAIIELINTKIEIFEGYYKFYTANGLNDAGIIASNSNVIILKAKNFSLLSIDGLNSELANIDNEINTIKHLLEPIAATPALMPQLKKLNRLSKNKSVKKENDIIEKASVESFKLDWFTFAGKVRNDEFRLFDPIEVFANQISKTNYVSGGLSTQFSHYRFSENENSLYYAIAVAYAIKSNYLDLDKKTITETTGVGSDNTSVRESSDSFIAYNGQYKRDIDEIKIVTDIYYFFDAIDRFGLHAYQNTKFSQDQKPLYDLGFGLVLPFKDQDKEKSIINAEIYYTIKNLFNTSNTGYNLTQRNEIGLRFTFPITF